MEVCIVLDRLEREGHVQIVSRGQRGAMQSRTAYRIPATGC